MVNSNSKNMLKNKKNKHAQGLSMNVIIIAALAMLVLVVLAFILFNRVELFGKSLQTCEGTCQVGGCATGNVAIPSDSGCVSKDGSSKEEAMDGKVIYCCKKLF